MPPIEAPLPFSGSMLSSHRNDEHRREHETADQREDEPEHDVAGVGEQVVRKYQTQANAVMP